MNNIKDVGLLDLLSPNFKENADLIAMSKALDSSFFKLIDELNHLNILTDIDNLPEPVLDLLLWQFHITYEEGGGLLDTIEEKRQFVKNAYRLHKLKGTKSALEYALHLLDMQGRIKEWFEYGGDPYFFKAEIDVTTKGLSENTISLLDKLINAYKNRRSWIEVINIYLTGIGKTYLASSMQAGEEITVYPWQETSMTSSVKANLGSLSQSVEKISVYPQ